MHNNTNSTDISHFGTIWGGGCNTHFYHIELQEASTNTVADYTVDCNVMI